MLPTESIATEGSGSSRSPPAAALSLICATSTGTFQVAPPSDERKDWISFAESDQKGTMTLPFGCTNCSAASPCAGPAVVTGVAQVNPPSPEVLIQTRFPLPLSSHSM